MKRTTIWSSGGGVQSTAIALLILQGKLPRPDRAVIADTGRETGETWEYLESYVNPELRRIGFTVERLHRQAPPLFNPMGTLLIPVFATGEAKFSNYCSSYWKRDIVKQWARSEGLLPATNWIGYSVDEMKRVTTPRANNWNVAYPLIFMHRMSRQNCIDIIAQHGWPPAPKSSCWLCPNRRNHQWRHLRDHRPEEFRKAIEAEREIHLRKPDVFLHQSCVPLDVADLGTEATDKPENMRLGCDSGDCFV